MSAVDPAVLVQWEEARRWFAKADEDRAIAALALTPDPPLLEPAAYHCQQAVEKIFKGLLVAGSRTIPRIHDLEVLGDLIGSAYPQLAGEIGRLSSLTPWGTATRYPDLDAELGVTAEDIANALIGIDTLRSAVVALDPGASS